MTKMMKALVKAKAEKGLWLQEVPVPEIAPDEVLIKIERTAICGTDMHIYGWDEWAQKNVPVPMVVGHEYGGTVAAVGSTVKRVKVGQRVTGEGHVVGTRSRNARAGKFHLDPDTKGIGVNLPGAFAEYLALPEFNVIPLPDSVSLDVAAILDPLGNAVHTALAFDLVGEDVLNHGRRPHRHYGRPRGGTRRRAADCSDRYRRLAFEFRERYHEPNPNGQYEDGRPSRRHDRYRHERGL